jgi:hypothetical protein
MHDKNRKPSMAGFPRDIDGRINLTAPHFYQPLTTKATHIRKFFK